MATLAPVPPPVRRGGYATPTGQPCPRSVRVDGSVEGTGDCHSCGCCLLLLDAAWPTPPV